MNLTGILNFLTLSILLTSLSINQRLTFKSQIYAAFGTSCLAQLDNLPGPVGQRGHIWNALVSLIPTINPTVDIHYFIGCGVFILHIA